MEEKFFPYITILCLTEELELRALIQMRVGYLRTKRIVSIITIV